MLTLTGAEGSLLGYLADFRYSKNVRDEYNSQIKDTLRLPVRKIAEEILGISHSKNSKVVIAAKSLIEWADGHETTSLEKRVL